MLGKAVQLIASPRAAIKRAWPLSPAAGALMQLIAVINCCVCSAFLAKGNLLVIPGIVVTALSSCWLTYVECKRRDAAVGQLMRELHEKRKASRTH